MRGSDRGDALSRLRRALSEFRVEGIATTLPFHRALLDDEVFLSGDYTTGFVAERMEHLEVEAAPASTAEPGEQAERTSREVEVEVDGRLFKVRVFGGIPAEGEAPRAAGPAGPPRRRKGDGARRASVSEGAVTSPMQGTIVRVLVEEGQTVEADEAVCVLEAMKMESEIRAQKSGKVARVLVEAGRAVRSGEPLVVLE